MSIKGCDNSHYQVVMTETLAKQALADGYVFDFHKVSEGMNADDPEWPASKAGATAAGLLIAGYHLGRNDATGGAQYAHYAKLCPDGPAVLDVEAGPAMSDATSDAWVAAAFAAGRQVIVYGIYSQIKRHRPALLWADALQPVGDAEFTQDGSAGVYGDLDHYHGSSEELAAIFGGDMGAADDFFGAVDQAITTPADFNGNTNYVNGFRFGRRGATPSAAKLANADFKQGYDDGKAWVPAGGGDGVPAPFDATITPKAP